MSMSLDGFISGVDDRPGQGLGSNGFRLFNWLDDRRLFETANDQQIELELVSRLEGRDATHLRFRVLLH